MAVDEKLLLKIKNLFNLAKDNSNRNEAENALLMAQKLMAQNNIEHVDIEGMAKPKEVLRENITEIAKLSWWEKRLGMVIARNFRCEMFTTPYYKKGSTVTFVGLRNDVELAKTVYNFARMAIARDSASFMKNHNKNKITIGSNNSAGVKNEFITGWISGLDEKYKQQVDKNGWGLVLVKDPAVQQYMKKIKLVAGAKSNIQRANNSGAYSSGYKSGNAFSSPRGMIE